MKSNIVKVESLPIGGGACADLVTLHTGECLCIFFDVVHLMPSREHFDSAGEDDEYPTIELGQE